MHNQFSDYQQASEVEFLLTNGLGGYASSTAAGSHTRRYHGYLVASYNPPTDRMVLFSKIEESILTADGLVELSANQYPSKVHPQGVDYLTSFAADTHKAEWEYHTGAAGVKKTVTMLQHQNTVQIEYVNTSEVAYTLGLTLLAEYRDYHSLFKEGEEFDFYTESPSVNQLKVFATYGAHPLYISFDRGTYKPLGYWHRNLEYAQEQARGFDFTADVYALGQVTIRLSPGDRVSLRASADTLYNVPTDSATTMAERAEHGLPALEAIPAPARGFVEDLIQSSRQFVVERKSTGGQTLIAGYPWFTDWGRDTMIALRGISIATGRQEESASILTSFLDSVSEGMLPNRFPDSPSDPVEYNTMDATLWLFVALHAYYEKFGDKSLVAKAMPILANILHHHKIGTRYNIHMLDSALLYGGHIGMQLTWMDAKVDNHVVTPRIGCPVEINALWYNALCIYGQFQKVMGHKQGKDISDLTERVKDAFVTYFLNDQGYLNDVVTPELRTDAKMRPNQIYALSLPFSPLPKEYQCHLLELVEENLLTPFGLRTLAPSDPDFRPDYNGDAWNRDTAYHQGTVWPFLLSEWALAYLIMYKFSEESCSEVWKYTEPLRKHFYEDGCTYAIAEIFDGLNPTKGKGCVQQAWSVGGLLQVFLHPSYNWKFLDDK